MAHTKQSVLTLIDEKDRLEQTIKDLCEILKTNNVGMTEPLIDTEGYPRSDIDVYQVRHARHQIKCLQNDHKALLQQIEEGISTIHSQARTSDENPNGTDVPPPSPTLQPFARVDHVVIGSPAHVAGLLEDDQLTKFGSVTWENFHSLSNIGQLVQNSVNIPIQVVVNRRGQTIKLSLTPRQWSGRGLLGCNIVPIELIDR